MSEIDARVAAMQKDIRSRREELDRLDRVDPAYEVALQRVLHSTAALVAFEEQIPAIVAEPYRRRSEQIITWVIRAFTGVILALGVVVAIPGWINGWWLLLLVPSAGFLALLWWSGPVEVGVRHVAQLIGALMLVVAAVLTFVILLVGPPVDWAVLGVVAIMACLEGSWLLLYIEEDAGEE
jgi:hypothetical protein